MNKRHSPRGPCLRFSPTAWAKLLFLRDYGETEVGGFGISLEDDLLAVRDVQLVKQVCTWVSVSFDDMSVADFYDRQVDAGRKPEQFARIWIHTHPGESASPTSKDEETFARVFGECQWAVMFILAQGGETYARLQFNVGPGGALELPVSLDFDRPFVGSDILAWEQEYLANVMQPDDERLLIESAGENKPQGEPHLDGLFPEIDPHWDRFLQEECNGAFPW